jgi:hypothetical protein
MLNSRLGIALGTSLLLSAIAPSAWAACTQADATGRWNVYVNSGGGWVYCPLTIGATGVVTTGARCTFSDGSVRTTLAGSSLTVQASCLATGRLSLSGGLVTTFTNMTISRDKFEFTGVGRDNLGGVFSYTGVKL